MDEYLQGGDRLLDDVLLFRSCQTSTEASATLRREVEREVIAIQRLTDSADAFDAIELLRLREFAVTADPSTAPFDSSPLPVEVVAAVMLARDSRQPRVADTGVQDQMAVEEIHERVMRLARLASFRTLRATELSASPLSRLAAEYAGSITQMRNHQFDRIRDAHDSTLLDTEITRELMQTHLGFSFPQLIAVRDAADTVSANRVTAIVAELDEIMTTPDSKHVDDVDELDRERARGLLIDLMIRPGGRSAFRAEEIAATAGLEIEDVERVLERFSLGFDPALSAENRVFQVLEGRSPFPASPLVRDSEGNYIQTSNGIGVDTIRRQLERALPANGPEVRRYDQKVRQTVSERLAADSMSRLLGTPPRRSAFKYLVARDESNPPPLGPNARVRNEDVKEVEGDLLFVVDDVMFIVEVKAKSIAPQAQRGDVARLQRELRKTIGEASDQASRLRKLITADGGFWETPKSWVDFNDIKDARCIVVMLDDVGPLGTQLADLRAADLLQAEELPLVLSMHDLAVIADICTNPAEFLLYLRRRTDSDVMKYFRALDELDLFMLFLDGSLYVEDDPHDVRSAHPSASPVTRHDEKLREASATPRMVGEVGRELSAWYSRGESAEPAMEGKPFFRADAGMRALVRRISELSQPGWLRLAARLLDLSGVEQLGVQKVVRALRKAMKSDGRYHDTMRSYVTLREHTAIFMAVRPTTLQSTIARTRLQKYAEVKQYQIQATEGFGLLFDAAGGLESIFMMERPPVFDTRLQALVREMGLMPIGESHRPLPPSAKRQTRRLRGSRKKR